MQWLLVDLLIYGISDMSLVYNINNNNNKLLIIHTHFQEIKKKYVMIHT